MKRNKMYAIGVAASLALAGYFSGQPVLIAQGVKQAFEAYVAPDSGNTEVFDE